MKGRLILLAGFCLALFSACGSGGATHNDATGKPELGSWGVDLTAMDASVKPGDDFFRYANGTWLKNYKIPADKTSFGSFLVLRDRSEERVRNIIQDLAKGQHPKGSVEQKISDYYSSYMDEGAVNAKGITPLKPLLKEINAISSRRDLIREFGRAGRESLASPIGGGIGLDRANPDRYMVNIGHGGLTLPDRDYYLQKDPRFQKIREAFKAHIEKMLGFAGVSNAKAKAASILALETEIARHHWPRQDLRNRDKTYNIYKLADLDSDFPGFDWNTFFQAAGVSDFDELNVTTPSAIEPLIKVVNATPLNTWKAYLTFHALTAHARVLSDDIENANFDFFGKVLSGQPQQRPRWVRGVRLVSGGRGGGLGEAIGQIYVKRYFPPESKAKMEQLVANLREAFRRRISGLQWMGDETKKEALAKLEAFNPKIAYPDKWRDYSKLEIVPGDLMQNYMNVREFAYQRQISRLHKAADRTEWFMTPQTVNAYYNSSWNEIVFPAAILQPPFFDPNADMAVNYGAIGAVIGHEMGHGFDDQGSKSDAKGVQRNWWTKEDRARFEERTKELGAQYDTYEPIPGVHINGQLTMGENLGDLGGITIAHEAYKISLNGKEAPVIDGYTGDQRFFLAFAQVWKGKTREPAMLRRLKSDPHSPGEFRTNGIVRNLDFWYTAFNVTKDQALYLPPEKRVHLW